MKSKFKNITSYYFNQVKKCLLKTDENVTAW